MRSTWLRGALAVIAAAAVTASVVTSQFSFVLLAMVALIGLGTSLGRAGRLTDELQRFRDHVVLVRVWDVPLPVPDGATLMVRSVRALGAGLHIHLHVGPTGKTCDLKVAQPKNSRVTSDSFVIDSARYVQWSGTRLRPAAGSPAVTVVLAPARHLFR
jgi:hypothetical protein